MTEEKQQQPATHVAITMQAAQKLRALLGTLPHDEVAEHIFAISQAIPISVQASSPISEVDAPTLVDKKAS